MHIDKLQIENFQLFAHQEFYFDPHFNLVIGVNGSGKSSLLRAVAVALGGWAHAYIENKDNQRPILDNEIREIQIDQRFDKTTSTSVVANGKAYIIDRYQEKKEGYVTWRRSRDSGNVQTTVSGKIRYGNYEQEYPFSFATLGTDTLKYLETGNKFALPLIAFYGCDRIWAAETNITPMESAKTQYSRFDAYSDCFHTAANHQQLGDWLLKHELASLQKGHETPVLQSIRSAAKSALEGCTGLRFDFEEGRVIVEFEGGGDIPFEHLSDGQRIMLGLFCDIARRAAILNPHFGGDASSQTKGVVLIDELDLHLHPRWQRKIIPSLSKLFPLIQFICTTHSAFLIQSLYNGKLIMLDSKKTTEFSGLSIEDIVEVIQGVEMPQRSQRYQEMMHAAEEFFRLLQQEVPIDEGELAARKVKLDQLSAPYSNDPAYQAFLNRKRAAKFGE